MGKYESELTRRFLLNSHSRGSLEEVVSEEEAVDSVNDEGMSMDAGRPEDNLFTNQWEGTEQTRMYFIQSYE